MSAPESPTTSEAARSAPVSEWEMVKPAERRREWAAARANDGTPFGFAVSPSATASDDWVIYLEGGGFCDDSAFPCASRGVDRRSGPSLGDGERFVPQWMGILSADPEANPTFSQANKVFAYYVSSDAWTGSTTERRPTPASDQGWFFSGGVNVEIMVEVLIAEYGLDDAEPGLRLLLAGGSSGGVGAEVNAEQVARRLPMTAAAGRLKVLNDGGAIIDFQHPDFLPGAASEPVRQVVAAATEFWRSRLPSTCPAREECLLERNLNRANRDLGIDVFVQLCSIDRFATQLHGIMDRADPAHGAAMDRFREQALSDLAEVPWLFSGTLPPYHTTLLSEQWQIHPEGRPDESLAAMVERFWNDGHPEHLVFEQAALP